MTAHAAFWGALAPHCYDDPSCISNTPAPVAQGIEHGSPKAGVGSSNLLWGTIGDCSNNPLKTAKTPLPVQIGEAFLLCRSCFRGSGPHSQTHDTRHKIQSMLGRFTDQYNYPTPTSQRP